MGGCAMELITDILSMVLAFVLGGVVAYYLEMLRFKGWL